MKCREQFVGKGQVTLCALEDIVHAGRWNDLADIVLKAAAVTTNPLLKDQGASLFSSPSLK